MTYFDHKEYISNSEFTKLMARAGYGIPEPPNLEDIFSFGILFEDLLLQPRKANYNHKDYALAKEMVRTAQKDPIISKLMGLPDFRIQHEYYRHDVFGFKGRCKTDGDSRLIRMMLELKSLSITTNNQFLESIDHFNYDRAGAWYINCTHFERQFMYGASKLNPKLPFRYMMEKDDMMYKNGVSKIMKVKSTINQLIGDLGLDDIAA